MLITYVSNLIKNKNICILGFGREGRSTYELFKSVGGYKSITICDQNPLGHIDGAAVVTGKRKYQWNLDSFDIIMKSPGIVMRKNALSDYSKLYSQAEIFLSVYRDRIIGVTGTKGKSTTSSLICHILKQCGKQAVLLGNIGIPPFDGEINENDTIVLELSSHQLEYTSVSPKTAVFLNVFPEHLDHYGSFKKYYNAKKNIYLYQKAGDTLIAERSVVPRGNYEGDLTIFGKNGGIIINKDSFSYFGETVCLDSSCPLIGEHNVNNIAAAYAAVKPHGITKAAFLSALSTFKPLPHRLENIGSRNGITYYDDSISTCSQTTIQALESLKNVGTVLIGGMDRGINYSPLISFLEAHDIPNVIFMYDTGKRIMAAFDNKPHRFKAHFSENLEDAVTLAKRITPKGTICLLSPAAASYGFFKNFEDRGDKFKQYALN